MALQFLLPLITSMATSAIGGAVSAGTASSANRRQAEAARSKREIVERMMREVRGGAGGARAALDEQATRDFSRAADQVGAQSAAAGMTNAGRGGQDALQAETLGGILAALAEAKNQDDLQRKQLLANMINDPAFSVPNPESFNPGSDALLGGLGGLASGGLNTMASMMGTEAGMGMLMDLFGGGGGADIVTGDTSMTGREANTRRQWAGLPGPGIASQRSSARAPSFGSGSGFTSNPGVSNVRFGR